MWFVLLIIALTLLIFWIQKQYNYWSSRGIPGPRPIPFLGNFGKSLVGKLSVGATISDIYNKYEGYAFVGVYRFMTPVLIIRDPDFLKNILVRDFKNFHDNDMEIDKEVEPVFGRNPFVMKGAEWKNKRAQLTACFTSGKIKGMYAFLEKSANRMVQYISDETNPMKPLEAREVCMRFTLDNVAACAFGLEGRSFDDPYSDFRELADKFLNPDSLRQKIIFLLFALCPGILAKLKLKLTPDEVELRLFELIRGSLKYRKDNKIVRNDFLDVVSNLPTENGLFAEIDIVAHAASFFGDGYETSSRVMSFLLFNLASNQDIQEKLRQEIIEVVTKNNNKVDYELVHGCQYLDACLSESLRISSVIHHLGKLCTEDYTYTPTDPKFKKMTVSLKAGQPIMLPVEGLAMDPLYFDEPQKFDPERFISNGNINKFTYFPFGEGQRACLGQRFATTQIKVGLVHILKNFKLTVNSKTQFPLKIDPYYIMRHVVGGLWLDFEKLV